MKEETFAAYNISDFRKLARRRLPKGLLEFIDRGTEDEIALRRNRAMLERIKLRPRTLALIGCRSIDELNPTYLRYVDADVPAAEVTP